MSSEFLNYAPREEFDVGLFVARYFQVLACLSIAWMVIDPIVFSRFTLDFSWILLFWAASALKRRSHRARIWVLIVAGCSLLLCSFAIGEAMLAGTEHMTIRFVRKIRSPSVLQVCISSGAMAVIPGIPFVLLLTERARRQFSHQVGKPEHLR